MMKKIRIAINGFGRIGRNVARQIVENFTNEEIEIVAVNDLSTPENLAYLFKYDSAHGKANFNISVESENIIKTEFHKVTGDKEVRNIRCFAERDPAKLPWNELNIDIVLECTGIFLTKEAVQAHINAGAKKVLISAPAKDDTPMYVYGVNSHEYKGEQVISMASCTTNCLAPIMKVLEEDFGVEKALMCTVHAMTATQPIVDGPSKKDIRGGRACAASIIPSTTGAAKAVGKVLPSLKGKVTGNSYRVPVIDGSVVDVVVQLKEKYDLATVLARLTYHSNRTLCGILDVTEEEIVSSDIIGNTHSSVVDTKSCIELEPGFIKIVSWYDNEWGYSARMIDTITLMMKG
jgi:glyceraldehyde 3-phosphate dehydrogenase